LFVDAATAEDASPAVPCTSDCVFLALDAGCFAARLFGSLKPLLPATEVLAAVEDEVEAPPLLDWACSWLCCQTFAEAPAGEFV
jgi:hypothetical protein